MRFVLDASAAMRLVLGHPDMGPAEYDRLEEAEDVLAPRLFLTEVANGLWKYVRSNVIREADALRHLDEADALVTVYVDDAEFAAEALSVAVRFGHPVYDALYAVTARRFTCPVLTVDERLKSLLASIRLDAL